jgi:GT2 family glycosyltransferase
MPDLSIIITNWNTQQLLLDCIASLYATIQRTSFEVFVVDNGSTDGSVEAVAGRYPDIKIIANARNEGFAKANNAALKLMAGTYAVLLNSDTLLKEGAIDRMFEFMQTHPRAGICGPQLLYGDGSKQTSFGVFPDIIEEFTSKNIVRLISPGRFSKRASQSLNKPAIVDYIMAPACSSERRL